MLSNKLNIVLLTGSNPYNNAGIIAYDMFKSLKNEGHNVLLLTRNYDVKFEVNMKSIYGKQESNIRDFIYKVHNRLKIRKTDPVFCMQSIDEISNYIPTKKILKKIPFKPDVFIYLFPHRFLNAKNLYELSLKTSSIICVIPADMAQFTGGCHYTNECTRFKYQCGCCPGLYSKKVNDITNSNLIHKKKYYSQTQLYTLTNTWTSKYITQSSIFINKPNFFINDVVNEITYSPGNKEESKKIFNIPINKNVIFFGATAVNEKRKGFSYLVDAINKLYNELKENEKEEIVIAIAGKITTDISSLFPFKVFTLGHLTHDQLIHAFRMADVFVSPSIQDTGPMMVLQSLMCGTPVVAFEMGNSVDYIINNLTGFSAPLYDTKKLKEGIKILLMKKEEEKILISKYCRDFAVKTASLKSFERDFVNIYFEFKSLKN
jgi:glycosyltransferase involved in cell wall biosynthesis